jgi:uncharacterized protein YigA (DUF484 family)
MQEEQMPNEPQTQQQPQAPTSETFEAFIEAQPENVKQLYTAHTGGLKTALETERTTRKELEKQLRELSKQAEQGSAAQKSLAETADKLSALEKQTTFFDKAHAARVRNLKLAYMAAQQTGLIDDKGECDFSKLKAQFPELFLSAPSANAGEGNGEAPKIGTMNDAIRRAAGRQ